MTTDEISRSKEIPRMVCNDKQFRRRGTDRWGWSMTTGQQAGIVLVVGIMVMGAIAASTKVQPQPSAHGREAPSIFDGVLSNVAHSPAAPRAECDVIIDRRESRGRSEAARSKRGIDPVA